MSRLVKGLAALVLAFAPTLVLTAPAQAASSGWSTPSSGGYYTCAIRSGAIYCWGRNDYGQLGVGDTNPRTTPTRVGTSTSWTTVAAGYGHTCGTRTNGGLYCWGRNDEGELGTGDTDPHITPTRVS